MLTYLTILSITLILEIEKYDLTQDDKFIIVASDGVWEFLENE